MKYKHIQAAHETRMWISTVIIPAIVAGITLSTNPQVQTWVQNKKYAIYNKIHK